MAAALPGRTAELLLAERRLTHKDWYLHCCATPSYQRLSRTPWYILQGSAFLGLVQVWYLVAKPHPGDSSSSSEEGFESLRSPLKVAYSIYRFAGFTWQLVIDLAMIGEYMLSAGDFSPWQHFLCTTRLLSASPNSKSSCAWLTVVLGLVFCPELSRATRLCTFREHVLVKAFAVYYTAVSLPYALLLAWMLVPGLLFLWVLLPGMILCLSLSPYLLRRYSAREDLHRPLDSEEECGECIDLDMEGTALESPLRRAGIQQFLVRALRWKQKRILQKTGDPAAVKQTALKLQQDGEDSLALRLLAEHGSLLESYGQVPADVRGQADQFIADCLAPAQAELDEELEPMNQGKHPGRAYKSRVEHKLLLFKAFRSPDVRVLWRSEVESFTQHRYLAATWVRRVPLYLHDDTQLLVLRPAGAEDEGAKLPNHFVVDIEKIVRDCMLLCPDDDALPGEVLHDAGQNPIVASSIGNTQHTQISKASVEEFPLMMQQQSPRWCGRLAAFLDIVQVGTSEDAFFVSAHTQQPDSKPLLEFFIQLRLDYMKAFGRSVDFNCTCHASTRGGFYVTLAPVACMRKIKVAAGQGCLGSDMDYLNPDSGDTVTKLGLPVATVDCSQGKGNVLCVTRELWERCLEGRALLSRLYDFNRKPGALAIAQHMLEKMLECVIEPASQLDFRICAESSLEEYVMADACEEPSDDGALMVRALVQSVQEKITELLPKQAMVVGATLMPLTVEERQQILEAPDLEKRLRLALDPAKRMSSQISESIQRSRDQEMKLVHRRVLRREGLKTLCLGGPRESPKFVASLQMDVQLIFLQWTNARLPQSARFLGGPLQALHLPTDLWQACAEVVACEECTPLGQGHLRAEPGRLFVSAQTFLVARGDLSPGVATARGLLWCLCGAVVGEGDSSAGAGAGDAGAARRRPNLCGWGHVCKNAGVLLYKHRATMGGTFDPLAPYTEEAAALAHLLSLRASEGQSRFVLLPSHPCSEQPKGDEVAEALELRLLLPELILQMGEQIQKAAKVLFRPLKVSDLGAATQVVLPQESFEAVCRRLASWTQRLPPSLSAAPQKGWKSSFLPRAPDGILENLFRAGYESRNDSLDAAVRAENLAAVLQSRPGRVEEAEALVREALSTLETAFPPEAGDVRPAGARARLAQILHLQGRTAEAEPLLRSALKAYEKSLGEDHPQALGCARNLAVLLKQQKTKLAEAEALLLRAAKGYAAAWGEEHPETQRLRRNLGNFRRWRKAGASVGFCKRSNLSDPLGAQLLVDFPSVQQTRELFLGFFGQCSHKVPGSRGPARLAWSAFLERRPRAHGFIFVGEKSDPDVGEAEEAEGKAAEVSREKQEDEEFSLDEFPKTCRMELKEGEPRACEAQTVEECMDKCRLEYVLPRPNVKTPLAVEDRKVCYNACVDHCVIGRTQDGVARPQCPLVTNGYSERYTVWESYEQLDPGKEVAKSEEVEPKVSIADMHSKILAQHKLAFGQKITPTWLIHDPAPFDPAGKRAKQLLWEQPIAEAAALAAHRRSAARIFLEAPGARGESFLASSFEAAPGTEKEAEEDLGPLDPHGNSFKQNKVCGYNLAPGEQRCCEMSTEEKCHECCVQRNFEGIEGEPADQTCRRTCVRMCYKGKDEKETVGKHIPRCPDDAEASVSLYPTNDQDRANFSYVYEMFMDMAECDGHSAYLFQDIPQQRSDDGFVRVLDAGARKRLYTGSKSKVLVGRLPQTTGESHIDNLQLPLLMRRHESLFLKVGHRILDLLQRACCLGPPARCPFYQKPTTEN
ncbi:unnamed protein product [Effrenium voratum]|nr:unnamed protein product [Effrenium voratum]